MRGVYGKRRVVLGAEAGMLAEGEGGRLPAPLLEQAKVAAVITLSTVAALVSIKVLFPYYGQGERRRRY